METNPSAVFWNGTIFPRPWALASAAATALLLLSGLAGASASRNVRLGSFDPSRGAANIETVVLRDVYEIATTQALFFQFVPTAGLYADLSLSGDADHVCPNFPENARWTLLDAAFGSLHPVNGYRRAFPTSARRRSRS